MKIKVGKTIIYQGITFLIGDASCMSCGIALQMRHTKLITLASLK